MTSTLRETLLAVLRAADGPQTLGRLAAAVGRAPTTVRFHLTGLLDDGLIETTPLPPAGRGRPRLAYSACPAMDPAGPREFGLLAGALAGALADDPDGAGKATRSGHRLGTDRADPAAETMEDLLSVLTGMGFSPATADGCIRLRRCPFLESAREYPAITCSVHRGLMQGVLDAHDDPRRVDLQSFVDGDHCLATIDPRTPPEPLPNEVR